MPMHPATHRWTSKSLTFCQAIVYTRLVFGHNHACRRSSTGIRQSVVTVLALTRFVFVSFHLSNTSIIFDKHTHHFLSKSWMRSPKIFRHYANWTSVLVFAQSMQSAKHCVFQMLCELNRISSTVNSLTISSCMTMSCAHLCWSDRTGQPY